MKIAHLCWSCDICEDVESPAETSWSAVRRSAFKAGWTTGRDEHGQELHVCPYCGQEG